MIYVVIRYEVFLPNTNIFQRDQFDPLMEP